MIEYRNECCDCSTPLYPCRQSACELRHVPHFFCDKCKQEVDILYEYIGGQWCAECILESYEEVTG